MVGVRRKIYFVIYRVLMKNTRLTSNTIVLTIGSIVSNGASVAITAICARVFAPNEFGNLMSAYALATACILIAGSGIPDHLTRSIAANTAKKTIPMPLRQSLRFLTGIGACAALMVFLIGLLWRSSNAQAGLFCMIASVWMVPFSAIAWALAVFDGFQRMRLSSFFRFSVEPAKLAILGILAYACTSISGKTVMTAWAFNWFLFSIAAVAVAFYYLRKEGINNIHGTGESTRPRFFSKSLPYLAPSISYALVPMLSLPAVALLSSNVESANLAAVLPFIALGPLVYIPFSIAFFPNIVSREAQGVASLKSVTKSILAIGITNTALLACVAWLGQELINIFMGTKYSTAVPILWVLAIAAYFDQFRFAIDPFLKAKGLALYITRAEIVRFIFCLILFPVLIPRYGALGCVAVLCIANVSAFVIRIRNVRRIQREIAHA